MTKHEYTEKVAGKTSGSSSSSSSSSDSDDEKRSHPKPIKSNRLFGRDKPLHEILGAGKHVAAMTQLSTLRSIFGDVENYYDATSYNKTADILLWRDKKTSGSILGCATALWVLFELLQYHLITLICHILILFLGTLFLWSKASNFIDKPPPNIPNVVLPEKRVLEVASILRNELNRALAAFGHIAFGNDVKSFLSVIGGLWIVSVVGSCFNFLTLVYIVFVLMHTVLVMYEKHEDKVDSLSRKAIIEMKKRCVVFDNKALVKMLQKGKLKGKKKD